MKMNEFVKMLGMANKEFEIIPNIDGSDFTGIRVYDWNSHKKIYVEFNFYSDGSIVS